MSDTNRPDFCNSCPIGPFTSGYVPLHEAKGSELWVGEAAGGEEITAKPPTPFVGGAGSWLNSLCRASHHERPRISLINIIGCHPPENVFPGSTDWHHTSRADALAGIEHCRQHHLLPALQRRPWSRIVALGDQALRVLTGQRGILKWRGSPLPLRDTQPPRSLVVPTLHPAYLMRQAQLFSVVVRDLRRSLKLPPEHYNLYPSIADLRAFDAKTFAFDFEWDKQLQPTLCGLSKDFFETIVVPWQGPYVSELRRIFEAATDLVGQNIIGADLKILQHLGWNVTAKLHDTMLMQHLVQPDMPHNLAFIASVFTTKVFWKGSGDADAEEEGEEASTGAQWKTYNYPDAIPRELGGYGGCQSDDEAFKLYNARDTDASYQAWWPLATTLQQYGMEHVYWNVSVPAAHLCRDMGERGIRIDATKVGVINEQLSADIKQLEQTLPEGLRPYTKEVMKNAPAPSGSYRPKTKTCKGSRKSPHEPQQFTFMVPTEDVVCPTCTLRIKPGKMVDAKIIKTSAFEVITPWTSAQQLLAYATALGCKQVKHAKTGHPTSDKSARKAWGRKHTEFTIVDQLKQKATLRNNFAKESLLRQKRVYFNLLVHGTSEGRLSSSGQRRGIDPNIQNQPKEVRVIYVPDTANDGFLEADWSSGENWLTAWLAQDTDRLERLGQIGYDEHAAFAIRLFNKPVSKACAECKSLLKALRPTLHECCANYTLRDPAKIINHGRNYGMGPKHMQDNLALEGFNYSLRDVEEMIEEWRKLNAGTARWQEQTIALAKAQGFLVNLFGRKRWFQSRNFGNKALAFLPASTLADMMLRCMIALHPQRFPNEISALGLQVVGELPSDWQLRWQVHDSIVCHGPHALRFDAADVVRAVLEQPWRELQGFKLSCEIAYSNVSWGDVKELQ